MTVTCCTVTVVTQNSLTLSPFVFSNEAVHVVSVHELMLGSFARFILFQVGVVTYLIYLTEPEAQQGNV